MLLNMLLNCPLSWRLPLKRTGSKDPGHRQQPAGITTSRLGSGETLNRPEGTTTSRQQSSEQRGLLQALSRHGTNDGALSQPPSKGGPQEQLGHTMGSKAIHTHRFRSDRMGTPPPPARLDSRKGAGGSRGCGVDLFAGWPGSMTKAGGGQWTERAGGGDTGKTRCPRFQEEMFSWRPPPPPPPPRRPRSPGSHWTATGRGQLPVRPEGRLLLQPVLRPAVPAPPLHVPRWRNP